MAIVLPPIRLTLRMSLSEATPMTREATTSGTAMSWSPLKKTSPNGEIQSLVNWPQPLAAAAMP